MELCLGSNREVCSENPFTFTIVIYYYWENHLLYWTIGKTSVTLRSSPFHIYRRKYLFFVWKIIHLYINILDVPFYNDVVKMSPMCSLYVCLCIFMFLLNIKRWNWRRGMTWRWVIVNREWHSPIPFHNPLYYCCYLICLIKQKHA